MANESVKKKRTPADNRRYRLHQKIKQLFEYYGKKKLVIIPYDYDLQDEFVIELRDSSGIIFNIQFCLQMI